MKWCPKCGAKFDRTDIIFCPHDGTRLTYVDDLLEGDTIYSSQQFHNKLIGKIINDRYKVLRVVGVGGMGVVYEVEHIHLEKRFALKLLREEFILRDEAIQRFRQEAIAATKIGHENIIEVTDFGKTEDGFIYFIMEYLEGEDLAEVLKREMTLKLKRAIPIIYQICKALYAAHQKGIIHRDMKPENIFLVQSENKKDFVKILDFGIAKMTELPPEAKKLTKTGMIFGTPEYMSPEQASGNPIDHRTDIYAVGIIMYEMFTGRLPFEGNSFMSILSKHLFEPPPPMREINPKLEIPQSLENVIYKSLAKDPEDRYQSMMELWEDIDKALKGYKIEPVKEGPFLAPLYDFSETTHTHSVKKKRKRTDIITITGILVLIIIVGGILGVYTYITHYNNRVSLSPQPNQNPLKLPNDELQTQVKETKLFSKDQLVDNSLIRKEEVPSEKLASLIIETPKGAKIKISGKEGTYYGPLTISLPVNNKYKITAEYNGVEVEKEITLAPEISSTTLTMELDEFKRGSNREKNVTKGRLENNKGEDKLASEQKNQIKPKKINFDKLIEINFDLLRKMRELEPVVPELKEEGK